MILSIKNKNNIIYAIISIVISASFCLFAIALIKNCGKIFISVNKDIADIFMQLNTAKIVLPIWLIVFATLIIYLILLLLKKIKQKNIILFFIFIILWIMLIVFFLAIYLCGLIYFSYINDVPMRTAVNVVLSVLNSQIV